MTKYAPKHDVVPVRRADLDLSQSDAIVPYLQSHHPSVVIYTAGTTNVDLCEEHPEESLKTNAEAPARLAEYCKVHGARLIHISTDYVFSGNDPLPRKESDLAEPINVYGRHKLVGEQAVLNASPEFLVVRVSWLFGKDRPSFPDMILKRALENDEVFAIADKVSCPTFSDDLAEWIEPMISDTRYRGILHLCNSGSCTWQEYGQKTLDIAASLGLPLRATTVQGQSRVNFPAFKAPDRSSPLLTSAAIWNSLAPRRGPGRKRWKTICADSTSRTVLVALAGVIASDSPYPFQAEPG